MKTITILVALVAIVFIAWSCKEKGTSNYRYKAESVIEMRTTPCYGRCPVYSVSIDGLGMANYEGKRFVDREGKHKKQFNAQETNDIFKTFEELDLWKYKDEYVGDVTDLPTTYLTFTHNGKTKKIRMYYDVPAELRALAKQVEEMTKTEGWQPQS